MSGPRVMSSVPTEGGPRRVVVAPGEGLIEQPGLTTSGRDDSL